MSRYSQSYDLLQEGVSSARAMLLAVERSEFFARRIDDPDTAEERDHGMWMLDMISGKLNDVQASVDAANARVKWDQAVGLYEKALADELAFDATHITPVLPDDLPAGAEPNEACAKIPEQVWEESSRLTAARYDAEGVLFEMPSPDLRAFAKKVILCRADGRDLNGIDDMLVSEARRLLGEQAA